MTTPTDADRDKAEKIVNEFDALILDENEAIEPHIERLADSIAQALADERAVQSVNIEFRNRDSNFGAECWTPIPAASNLAVPQAEYWMKHFAQPDIHYRVVRVVSTREAALAAKEQKQ